MEELISIVIPVYNTEKYLVQCLESLTAQTYPNMQIVLVNDGSTDNSLSICEAYATRYPFIKVYSQENAGQGSARNFGISKCSGSYIMFVDSDDWVDREIVQKLYDNINASDSNIAVCNFMKTYINQFDRYYRLEEKISSGRIVALDQEKDLLNSISVYACGKLIRRKIFDNKALRFPNHFFEDAVMMPIVYVLADKISFIGDALYYYRNRTGSTVNSDKMLADRIYCMTSLIENFKKFGLYDKYREQLKQNIEQRIQINLRMAGNVLRQRYKEFADRQEQTARQLFSDVKVKQNQICVVGSYSLMTIAKVVMNYEADKNIEMYFGRESLISIMGKNGNLNEVRIGHGIPMKNKCLINDFSKRLAQSNPGEFQNTDYVFLDLLEERFDIGVYKGDYFTLSDAFCEVEKDVHMSYTVIRAESEEWFTLWKEACNRFIKRILAYVHPEQVVIVEMKLSEQYVDENGRHDFKEIGKIRECNERLQTCYDYIKQINNAFRVIPVAQMECYVTDADFRHGCFPWHLGNMSYVKIGEYIKEALQNENTKTETAPISYFVD